MEDTTMAVDPGTALLISGAIGAAGATAGGVIGGKMSEKAYKRQKRLMGTQYEYTQRAADEDQRRAMELYDYEYSKNTVGAIKGQYEEAGFNPWLAVTEGGGGGRGGGASASGAGSSNAVSAAPVAQGFDPANAMSAGVQAANAGMTGAKMKADIDLTKAAEAKALAEAEKLEAEKGEIQTRSKINEVQVRKIMEETTTIVQLRPYQKRELEESGIGKNILNAKERFMAGMKKGNEAEVDADSLFSRRQAIELLNVMADTDDKGASVRLKGAQRALTDAQAQGYWADLQSRITMRTAISGLMNEQAAGQRNVNPYLAAEKLQNIDTRLKEGIYYSAKALSERWGIGEYTNWKTWVSTGTEVANTVAKFMPTNVADMMPEIKGDVKGEPQTNLPGRGKDVSGGW